MLTCACGARFEVDDTLAGQEVLCPECQQPLKAPALDRPPQVTSGWALASIVCALVGAFTVLGTVLAVLLGFYALVHIARNRQRVAGAGLAVTGICLGILFTVLTVFALTSGDLFGLDSMVRERTMAQQLDTSGPMEIVRGLKGFAITRPTEKWGQVLGNQSGDPAVSSLQHNRDLLLMQAARHAFIDVRTLPAARFKTLDQCESDILAEFDTRQQRPQNPLDDDDDEDFGPVMQPRLQSSRPLGMKDGVEVREMIVDVRCAGQSWQFLIRLHRRNNGAVYVVRAYTPRRQLARIKNEMESALDSFRLLPR
jgi:hypothetical protein